MHRAPSVARLIECLELLPGIGPKTSERLAYHLLRAGEKQAIELADAIAEAIRSIVVCSVCFNLDEQDPCRICRDDKRDRNIILVVESPRDLAAFEASAYRGLYHVLQGRVSGLEGIRPEDLTIEPLARRAKLVKEVCLATNPDLEGEGTSRLIAERLGPTGVQVTRLARGLPAGASISQVSSSILADAVEGRRTL